MEAAAIRAWLPISEGATGHLGAGAGTGVDIVETLLHQLLFVHLGGRRQPEARRDGGTRGLLQFGGGVEVTDAGHAADQ